MSAPNALAQFKTAYVVLVRTTLDKAAAIAACDLSLTTLVNSVEGENVSSEMVDQLMYCDPLFQGTAACSLKYWHHTLLSTPLSPSFSECLHLTGVPKLPATMLYDNRDKVAAGR